MNEEELKKEVEKFKSVREKVLRLNEITKCASITYGLDYTYLSYNNGYGIHFMHGKGGCIFCGSCSKAFTRIMSLKIKNWNNIQYYPCNNCKDKTLCAYCLREKESCNLTTKKKITFYLSSQKTFSKDIRRLITNLFFV